MKRRTFVIGALAVLSLGVGILAGIGKEVVRANAEATTVNSDRLEEIKYQVFGHREYDVVSVSTQEELKQAFVTTGCRLIEVENDIIVGDPQHAYYLTPTMGFNLLNLKGHTLYSNQPGMIEQTSGGCLGLYNGTLACSSEFIMNRGAGHMVNVKNSNIVTDYISIRGNFSAVQVYNSVALLGGSFNDSVLLNGFSVCIGGTSKVTFRDAVLEAPIAPFAYPSRGEPTTEEMGASAFVNFAGGLYKRAYGYGLFTDEGNLSNRINAATHIYGGRFYLGKMLSKGTMTNITASLGSVPQKDQETMEDALKAELRSKIETYCPALLDSKLGFKVGSAKHPGAVDALMFHSKITYSYKVGSAPAVMTEDFSAIPSGKLDDFSATLDLDANGIYQAYQKAVPSILSALSFDGHAENQIDINLGVSEKAIAKTAYAFDEVRSNPELGYFYALSFTFHWETINTSTGEKGVITNGFPSMPFSSDKLSRYSIKCEITASNGVDKSLRQSTGTIYLDLVAELQGRLIAMPSGGDPSQSYSDYSLLRSEEKTFVVNDSELLVKGSGAKLRYQWYLNSSGTKTPIPGATKSSVRITGEPSLRGAYLFCGVKAVYTNARQYDVESEEMISNRICLHVEEETEYGVKTDFEGENVARKAVALGTEVTMVATPTGDTSAFDTLTYSWWTIDEEGNNHAIANKNTTSETIQGANTDELTYQSTMAQELTITCLLTAKKGTVTRAVYSYPLKLTFQNAGVPFVVDQPRSNRLNITEDSGFQLFGLTYVNPDEGHGGVTAIQWYRSTDAIDPNAAYVEPENLNYMTISGATSAVYNCTASANPGSGRWYYYATITNTVNGYRASTRTDYVCVIIRDHTPAVLAELVTPMAPTLTCEVGDEAYVSFEYGTYTAAAGYPSVSRYDAVYCDAIAEGTDVPNIERELVKTSEDGKSKTYRVTAKVDTSMAGEFSYHGIFDFSQTVDPYDGSFLSGYAGDQNLTTVVTIKPKSNIAGIVSVAHGGRSVIAGSLEIGDLSLYQTGEIGAAIGNSRAYISDGNGYVDSGKTVAESDNFVSYDLFVEKADGTFVKVGESDRRDALPSFDFDAWNSSLGSGEGYASDYSGFLNAYVRVHYTYAREFFTDSYGGMVNKGLYLLGEITSDSPTFMLNVIANCAHESGVTKQCHHDTMMVDTICDSCGVILSTEALTLVTVPEKEATCHESGLREHKECPICHEMFDMEGNPTTAETLMTTKDHTYVHHEATSATCTEDGYEEYWSCSECGDCFIRDELGNYVKINLDSIRTPAHHHASNEWAAYSEGHYHTCTECGQIVGEVEPHVDENEDGLCDICGYDLNAAPTTVHVTLVHGTFADGTTEKDVEVNGVVLIKADSIDGKIFEGWYINGTKVSNDAQAQIRIQEACTIEARYVDDGSTPVVPDKPADTPKKGLPAGAIVGIVIGSVVVVGLAGFSIFWFVVKKKTFKDLFPKKK